VRHLAFGRPGHDYGGEVVLHQAAHYVLARGAIENFATALWLLGPRRRSDRIERLIRWHVQDIHDCHSALDRFANDKSRTRESRLARLEEMACSSLGERPPRFPRGYSTTEVVKYADEFRSNDGSLTTHFIWQLCSAFAHVRPWATLSFLEHDLSPTEDADIFQARFTSSMGRALLAPRHALNLCAALLERHRALNRPAFSD
jgi:hypothetical protein